MNYDERNLYIRIVSDPRDPNYVPPKSNYICCECKEGIYSGESYIENCNGEYIHVDCIPSSVWLVSWLGHEIKEMEE